MKKFCFKINQRQVDSFFRPIRDKRECLCLLMELTKFMIINQSSGEDEAAGEIHLIVSKMSRLFLFSKDKYVSINFPFSAVESDGQILFSSLHIDSIDSKITSDVVTCLLDSESFSSHCVFDFINPLVEFVEVEENFWHLMRELLLLEDGYVRYDYDEVHENGGLHPLHHYDIFYSNSSTFKIGLRAKPYHETMIDFLNLESGCNYIEGPSRTNISRGVGHGKTESTLDK